MGKMRVHELAKELGKESSEIIRVLDGLGVRATASSGVDDDMAAQIRKRLAPASAASATPRKSTAAAPAASAVHGSAAASGSTVRPAASSAGNGSAAAAGSTARPASSAGSGTASAAPAGNGTAAAAGSRDGAPGENGAPKKKRIMAVFRPQNSKTGMIRNEMKKRPPRPAAPGQARPQGQGAPAQGRPQGQAAPGSAQARPQGQAAPGSAAQVRPQGQSAPAAGNAAASAAAGSDMQARPQGQSAPTAGNAAASTAQARPQGQATQPAASQAPAGAAASTASQAGTPAHAASQASAPASGSAAQSAAGTGAPQGQPAAQAAGQRPQGAGAPAAQSHAGSAAPQGTASHAPAGSAAGSSAQTRPQGSGTQQRPQGTGAQNRPQDNRGQNQNRSGYGQSQSGDRRGQGDGRRPQRPGDQRPSQSGDRRPYGSRDGQGRGASGQGGDRRNGSGSASGSGRFTPGRGGSAQPGRGQGGFAPAAGGAKTDKNRTDRNNRGTRRPEKEKGDKFDRMERGGTGKNGKNKNPQRPGAFQKPVVKNQPKAEEQIRTLVLPDTLTLRELAEKMKIQPAALVKKLFLQGKMVTVNQELEYEQAEEIALEYNILCEHEVKRDVIAELLQEENDPEETLVPRPPVVCVMGHVDHGKTSLLDAIRNTHVIDREAGGITQHIGASVIEYNDRKITFLDTPGHEAFTAMRMRGANSTDIAVLVVAADDGVMPQTVEAINHAKAAGIEIIVAINKIDKPSANVERVKQELTEYELVSEDWGGSTIMVPVSAHTHEGIDDLLEMILLTADVLELKANPNRRARGLVIEAKLDKGRGPVASVLVQKGTLHVGEPICAGPCYGKIRAMTDSLGRRVKEAGPSTPVEIIGFSDVPGAGEIFMSPETEKEAKNFAETFVTVGREKMLEETKSRMSLDDLFSQIQAGSLKELNLIVKADVQGSVEAVKQSLLKLSNDEVVVKIIHGAVGAINESDVTLAGASNAIIIGFNVRPDAQAKATADQEGVDIRLYRVIYDAINDVEAAMKGMLDPIFEEKVTGHVEVRQIFRASGVGTIAGSYVLDGTVARGSKARITHDGEQIFDGDIASLKRFKDDVKEVRAGYECGLVFDKFNDVHEGDLVEVYTMVEVPR